MAVPAIINPTVGKQAFTVTQAPRVKTVSIADLVLGAPTVRAAVLRKTVAAASATPAVAVVSMGTVAPRAQPTAERRS